VRLKVLVTRQLLSLLFYDCLFFAKVEEEVEELAQHLSAALAFGQHALIGRLQDRPLMVKR